MCIVIHITKSTREKDCQSVDDVRNLFYLLCCYINLHSSNRINIKNSDALFVPDYEN